MIYFFWDGLVDSSAGFGAAVLLSSLGTGGLFWIWRRIRNIYIRLAVSDEAFQMPNMEYFTILGISLAVSVYLTSIEEGIFKRENVIFASIIIPLLFIVSGVCFYWLYYVIMSSVRARKHRMKEYMFTDTDLVVYGSLRTVTIPCTGITSMKKVETYTGLSAVPTAISRPKTTELLIVESRSRKSPVALTWPGEKGEAKIRDEAGRRGAVLMD